MEGYPDENVTHRIFFHTQMHEAPSFQGNEVKELLLLLLLLFTNHLQSAKEETFMEICAPGFEEISSDFYEA